MHFLFFLEQVYLFFIQVSYVTFLSKDGKIKKRKSVVHSARMLWKCQTDAVIACHQLWMYSHPIEPATKTSQVQFTVQWGSTIHKATETPEGSWNQRGSHQKPWYKAEFTFFFKENAWNIEGKYVYLNMGNSGISTANIHEMFTYITYMWKVTLQKFLQDLNLS